MKADVGPDRDRHHQCYSGADPKGQLRKELAIHMVLLSCESEQSARS